MDRFLLDRGVVPGGADHVDAGRLIDALHINDPWTEPPPEDDDDGE